jgi:hypothetical protein
MNLMGNPGANILVPVALIAWTPIVIFLFKKFDPRLVPVIAYVAGWMFLPCAEYDIFLLHNTKMTVIGLGVLIGAYLTDRERLTSFKFTATDFPMLLWCTAPFFSSIVNGLGAYDGGSSMLYQTITWGLPYYIGRVYFSDTDVLKTLALTIFIGGIIYIPFCWIEMIMSPQLHRLTYGFHQHDFIQSLRDNGGYRPMVYMTHGLMTSMWMMLGSLFGCWLYYCKELPDKILFIPSKYLVMMLVFTTIIMQSMGATIYLFLGIAVLYLSSKMKNYALVIVLLFCPLLYIFARVGGSWDGRNISSYVSKKFSPTRAQSLQFRFDNETLLMVKALDGSFFGWAGYGRSRVYDKTGKDITVTDGFWIIVYGVYGIYGLSVMILTIQLPVILFLVRIKPEKWKTGTFAAPAAMAIFISLTMIDNLLNAMINPIYMICGGGLIGMLVKNPDSYTSLAENNISDLVESIITGTRFIGAPDSQPSRFII